MVNNTITAQHIANRNEEGSELVLNDLVNVGKCPVQQAHSSLYARFNIYICLGCVTYMILQRNCTIKFYYHSKEITTLHKV